MTSIELFTGGGGLALAMEREGFRHLLAVEWDKRACATVRLNRPSADSDVDRGGDTQHGWPLVEGDVHAVDFQQWEGQVDVVAGGVPCQPWSLGGVHRGFEDKRNLWPELFRTVREVRPKAIIAENVRGLLRPSFNPYYQYILRELSAPFEERVEGEEWPDHDRRLVKALSREGDDPSERYDVFCLPVNAANYGVPQVRNRVFVVAFRRDLGLAEWRAPKPTHSRAALLREQSSGAYWERLGLKPRAVEGDPLPDDLEEGATSSWVTLREAIAGLPEPEGYKTKTAGFIHHYGWPGARQYAGHTPNELDKPAKTVKAGVHGVPGGETVLRKDDGSIAT